MPANPLSTLRPKIACDGVVAGVAGAVDVVGAERVKAETFEVGPQGVGDGADDFIDVGRRAALRDHVGDIVDVVRVVALAADEAVGAGAAVQVVVAVVAGQGVVAGLAVQAVAARIAGDLVGERIALAVDVGGAGQRQVLDEVVEA